MSDLYSTHLASAIVVASPLAIWRRDPPTAGKNKKGGGFMGK
jgi:hypothetical protein